MSSSGPAICVEAIWDSMVIWFWPDVVYVVLYWLMLALPVRLPSVPNTAVMVLDAASDCSPPLPLLYAIAFHSVPVSGVGLDGRVPYEGVALLVHEREGVRRDLVLGRLLQRREVGLLLGHGLRGPGHLRCSPAR